MAPVPRTGSRRGTGGGNGPSSLEPHLSRLNYSITTQPIRVHTVSILQSTLGLTQHARTVARVNLKATKERVVQLSCSCDFRRLVHVVKVDLVELLDLGEETHRRHLYKPLDLEACEGMRRDALDLTMDELLDARARRV